MNTFCKSVFASTLSALMLASCANEELSVATENGGSVVTMTVTASREGGDVTSRTQLTDNNTGRLDCVWTAGDCLYVTDASGIVKGVLTLTDGAGSSFATFTGDLYGVRNGATVFNYVYLGTKNNGLAFGAGQNSFTADYSSQEGTLMSLAYNDMMTATATVTVNKGNAAVDNINLQRRVSFARFQLNLPDDATIGHPCNVTLSGELLCNGASVNFADRAVTTAQGDVTVTTSAEGDFYMTYLPTASEYKLTFTATDGENTYAGEYEVKSAIGENVYFRKKLVENEIANYVAIPVEMKKVGEDEPTPTPDDTDCVGPAFEVECADGVTRMVRFTCANLIYHTSGEQEGLFEIPEKQTDFTCASGRRYNSGMGKNPAKIGLFRWGATGVEDNVYEPRPADFWKEQSYQTNSYNLIDGQFPSANTSYNSTLNTNTTLMKSASMQDTPWDWGKAYGDQQGKGHYFTLTSKAWCGVIDGNFTALGTVDGVYGAIIIFNEDLEGAKAKIEAVGGKHNQLYKLSSAGVANKSTFDWKRITLTYEQLTELDAVFFPANGMNNPAVESDYGSTGYYWTSTVTTTPNAMAWVFDGQTTQSSRMFQVYGRGKGQGMAVRLVKEVSVAGN